VGRNGLSNCQVSNGKRLGGGLVYFQGSSNEILDCQVDNEKLNTYITKEED
jgi:hypothetical protein